MSRAIQALLFCVVALVILGAIIYEYWNKVQHRFTVVTPGLVYQSAAMPPQTLVRVATERQIQTVFDFRGETDQEPAIVNERTALQQAGIRYIHIPSSTSPGPETVRAFLHAMAPEVAAHRTVLLHCHDGEGRAVFYSAVYRMQFEGWDNQRAYLGTTRLPPSLLFLSRSFPSIGLMSPRNYKAGLIREYQREPNLTP